MPVALRGLRVRGNIELFIETSVKYLLPVNKFC